MAEGLESNMYEEQLRSLSLFSLEETKWEPHHSQQLFTRGGEGQH